MATRIKKIQTPIFTRNFNIVNDMQRSQLLLDIENHSRDIFNVSPVLVTIPNDAPPEIPRILISNTSGQYSGNIALSRTDVFFNIPENENRSLDDLLRIQKNNSKNIFSFLISKGIIIQRIGFVTIAEKSLTPEEGKNGNEYLRKKFIKSDRMQSPKEIILRYNHRTNIPNSFEMNNVIQITGKLNNTIILQTDINTVAKIANTANFTLENFEEIIDYAIQKTKELINNFPEI